MAQWVEVPISLYDEVESKNFQKTWQNSLVSEFLATKTNSKNFYES